VQDAARLALASTDDRVLCMNAKSLTQTYNASCGKELGVLQVVECK